MITNFNKKLRKNYNLNTDLLGTYMSPKVDIANSFYQFTLLEQCTHSAYSDTRFVSGFQNSLVSEFQEF